jgi:N-acetylglucosamine-6-phosphate deacetylase
MKQQLRNVRVFDGDTIREGLQVVIDGNRIDAVVPADECTPTNGATVDLGGGLLAPGFIDVQVNGGGRVLFNDRPDVEGIRTIAETHRSFGTTGMLPTLISDQRGVMEAAIAAVGQAVTGGVPGILGIHLEGPYLNPLKRGIHRQEVLREPEEDALSLLAGLGDLARTVVTLAPECVSPGFIRSLADRGIIVCAGHTAASAEAIERALREGLRGFTHLFNAMTPMTSREPGAVGVALADPESWCGLIVDGLHVHPTVLKIALAAKPRGRTMLVTDAVHAVGSDVEHFELLGEALTRRDGLVTNANGTLAGSDLTMNRAVANAVELLGLPVEEALRMASLYPAGFLGMDDWLGRIAPGYRADLVLLAEDFHVLETWIGGQRSPLTHRSSTLQQKRSTILRRD